MATLVTKGMNALYYSRVDMLNKFVYNKDTNIIPYMPDREFLFTDWYPQYSVGTVLKAIVNGGTPILCMVLDTLGTIYFNGKYPYGFSKVVITDNSNVVLKSYEYLAVNTYLYYEIESSEEMDRLVEKARIKNDSIFDLARDDQLYNNFGSLMYARQPSDFSASEYRTMLTGLKEAYLNGGTIYAMSTACFAITGATPTIDQTLQSWKVYKYPKRDGANVLQTKKELIFRDNLATSDFLSTTIYGAPSTLSYISVYDSYKQYAPTTDYTISNVGSNGKITWVGATPTPTTYYTVEYATVAATQTHSFVHDIPNEETRIKVNPGVVTYSGNQKAYSVILTVNNSSRAVTAERVVKAGDGEEDVLTNRNMAKFDVNNEMHIGVGWATTTFTLGYDTSKYSVVPNSVSDIIILYTGLTNTTTQLTEGVDFTVNRGSGVVTWIHPPPLNIDFTVSYSYGSLTTIVADSITYYEGVDYTLDRDGGTILWGTGAQPAKSYIYTVNYRYILKDIISNVIERLKPAHIRVNYVYNS